MENLNQKLIEKKFKYTFLLKENSDDKKMVPLFDIDVTVQNTEEVFNDKNFANFLYGQGFAIMQETVLFSLEEIKEESPTNLIVMP